MKKPLKQVRHQAKKHETEHAYLKELLSKKYRREKWLELFIGTFLVAFLTLIIFLNWGNILGYYHQKMEARQVELEQEKQLQQAQEAALSKIQGFHSGIKVSELIHRQGLAKEQERIEQIKTRGFALGLAVSETLNTKVEKSPGEKKRAYLTSILLSTRLGDGEHLLASSQRPANTFLKTILTGYYLGEKTNTLKKTLASDTEILEKVKNALSVDLFAYLNQSVSRADSLQDYLELLKTLQANAQGRNQELATQLNYLSSNFKSQEQGIKSTEEEFFRELQNLSGEKASDQLDDFIEKEQTQAEIRAKVGAYQQLQKYYNYYLPFLDNRIRAIEANRSALIAGVRVVEIENMQLDLIIPEK